MGPAMPAAMAFKSLLGIPSGPGAEEPDLVPRAASTSPGEQSAEIVTEVGYAPVGSACRHGSGKKASARAASFSVLVSPIDPSPPRTDGIPAG